MLRKLVKRRMKAEIFEKNVQSSGSGDKWNALAGTFQQLGSTQKLSSSHIAL
jgi:hypothetical protein